MKVNKIIICILSLIFCIFSCDCILYDKTIDSLNNYIPIINRCLLNKEEVYENIPSNYIFDITKIGTERVEYQLGLNVDFSFYKSKLIKINGYCNYIESDFA